MDIKTRVKRVAVVGGGFAGLGMIKALKEESLEPVCFEKTAEVGGTWYYREEAIPGVASTTSTTSLNHSKELGSVSNFPFAEHLPNYMKHDLVYEYILTICKEFDLLKHVTCNRDVIKVAKAEDYEETGRWTVTVKNTITGEITSDIYDAVMVCAGQLGNPEMPTYPGMEKFKGTIMHTHSLKTFESFTGKQVVVVGTGCSALDAATEISNVAKQVYLSIRTPTWIIPRVGYHGLPFDYVLLRRCWVNLMKILPISLSSKFVELFFLPSCYRSYGIKAKYHFLCKDPTVSDALPAKVLTGTVILKNNIREFQEDGVIFEGSDERIQADYVVLGTGYTEDFSFIEDGVVVEEKKGKYLLYKGMYPTHLKHPTLAIIGFLLTFGPGVGVGEMQTRWAAHLLGQNKSLPTEKVMKKDVEKRYRENLKRFPYINKLSQRVDVVQYMDDLASKFGVKPNLLKMAFTDPKLFWACYFGPSVNYQYRLVGPHKWENARETILTAPKRTKKAMKQYAAGNR